ncbi:hypothetical protein C0991_004341 [Blastosporella zonata]|nr:hypothetical protein C0991_004341 [Blastosporella zonata]
MKFTTVFTVLAAAAAASASAFSGAETNADRMARGLPPLPPNRRATGVARRAAPSSTPTPTCTTGPVQCCNSVTTASDPIASLLAGLLGLVLGADAAVGLTCSPLSLVLGRSSWYEHSSLHLLQ